MIREAFYWSGFLWVISAICLLQKVLGKVINHPTDIDSSLSDELASYSNENSFHFDVIQGDTMCCDDFYEGKWR